MTDLPEIDPAAALEILPKRIIETKKAIQEFLIDLAVIEATEGHNPAQVESLRGSLAFHQRILANYEARLDAIKNAANAGPPTPPPPPERVIPVTPSRGRRERGDA